MLKKSLVFFVVAILCYAIYSIYYSNINELTSSAKQSSLNTSLVIDNTLVDNVAIADKSKSYEGLTCDSLQSVLQVHFKNSEYFLQSHQAIFNQLLFNNTALDDAVRDKIATTVGLQYSYQKQVFDKHLRKAVDIYYHENLPALTPRLEAFIAPSLALEKDDYKTFTELLSPLIASSIDNRIGLNIPNRIAAGRTLFGLIAFEEDKQKQKRIIDAILETGYQLAPSDIIDLIIGRVHSENIQYMIDAFNGDLNFVFAYSRSSSPSNLVLASVRVGKFQIAEYLIAQGMDTQIDVQAQWFLAQDRFWFSDNENARKSLERLFDTGVFLFPPDFIALATTQAEITNAFDPLSMTIPAVVAQSIYENMLKLFGKSKTHLIIESQTRADLLTSSQREIFTLQLAKLVTASKQILPLSLQDAFKNCDIDYASALSSLQAHYVNSKVDLLYKPLEENNPTLSVNNNKQNGPYLNQEQIDELRTMTSFAAKAMLDRDVFLNLQKYSYKRAIRGGDEQPYNEFHEGMLDTLVNDGVDQIIKYANNSDLLNAVIRQELLFELLLQIGAESSLFSTLVSNDSETNFYRMRKFTSQNRFELLEAFVNNNANINFEDTAGRSLLWYAINYSSKESFDYLLNKNIQIQSPNTFGFDALDLALNNVRIKNNDFYFVHKLLAQGHDIKPSHVELLRDLAKAHYDTVVSIIEQYDVTID